MSATSEVFGALLEAHRSMGSPLPDSLNPPVEAAQVAEVAHRLGHDLPTNVVELLSIADGVAQDRWLATYRGVPAQLMPGYEYPPLSSAWEHSKELRRVVKYPFVGDEEPAQELWRDDWLLVFTNEITGDEHIVVASDRDRGSLWTVAWEFEMPRRLRLTMPELLDAAVARFQALDARWDRDTQQLLWNYDREEDLDMFP